MNPQHCCGGQCMLAPGQICSRIRDYSKKFAARFMVDTLKPSGTCCASKVPLLSCHRAYSVFAADQLHTHLLDS